MRPLLAAVTLVLSMAALTGCGEEDATGTATTATTASQGTSSTLQAYELLAEESTRFVAAAAAAGESKPDVAPRSAEELLALIDYTFADGVTLSEYDEEHFCLTGPEQTYLSLFERKDDLRRSLGTGECAYDDGDVVLEITFTPGARLRVGEHVIKGTEIAQQIPALDGFVDQLNEAFADSDVPENDMTTSGADQ